MLSPEIEEFAKALVAHVRDPAVQDCDILLRTPPKSTAARRWQRVHSPPSDLHPIVPDAVDQALFFLLHAIDEGDLRLKFVSSTGREVDLTEDGKGELAGWYMMTRGWREMYSDERFNDDNADVRGSE